MKLAKVAISVAVVIGAVATGGSWYTGKQVEQRYGELVQRANQSLQTLKFYGVQAELKDVQVERGLFSSDVRYNLEIKDSKATTQFKGNDKLYHGPFPLNRLMKGNIVPAMASAESQIAVPDNLKAYFAKETLLSGQSTLSYSETWQGDYTFSPIKWAEVGLETSEIHYAGEVEKDGKAKGKVVLPQLKATPQGENPAEIQLNELEYGFDFDKAADEYALLGLGNVNIKFKSLSFKDLDSKPSQNGLEFDRFELSDVDSESKTVLNGGKVESISRASGKLALGNQETKADLGKLSAESLVTLDAKSANEMLSYVTNPDNLEKNPEAFHAALMNLVSKGIQYHLNDVTLENSKGKSDLTVQLNLAEGVSFENFKGLDDALKLFKQSKFAVKLNRAMAEETLKQFASLDKSIDNKEAFAKSRIDELFQMADQSDVAVVKGDNVEMLLELDQGKVKLNGNDVPEEQVQGVLFMLMLGLLGSM